MSGIQDDRHSMNSKAVTLQSGEGKSLWVLGDLYTIKLAGDETGGSFAMLEARVQPQNEPPPHVHLREDETFYILEGEFTFLHGDHKFTAISGSVVHIPKGTLHTFKNVGTSWGRFVVVITPAGFEELFEQIGEPVTDQSSPPPFNLEVVERLLELAPKYYLEVKLR